MTPFQFLLILSLASFFAAIIFISKNIATSIRRASDEFFKFRVDQWLDLVTERTIRIVEEGGLPLEFGNPTTSEEKQNLACSILQDVVSYGGLDVQQYNIPALIQAKVNEVFHGHITRKSK